MGIEDVTLPTAADVDALTLTGVNSDTSAGPGDLAWIKAANASASRLQSFGGTALIRPAGHRDPERLAHAISVYVDDPKRVFAILVDAFFVDAAATTWPASAAQVHPTAQVGQRVEFGPNAVIGANTVIGNDVRIGPNTCIANTIIHDGVVIGANCSIGLPGFGYAKHTDGHFERVPHVGRVVIESQVEIGSNTCIDRGSIGDTRIGWGAKIDNLVHVAHNVVIARDAVVIANAMLGGSVTVGERAWIAPSASVLNQKSVGADAVIGMAAVVLRDVEAGETIVGNPGRVLTKRSS